MSSEREDRVGLRAKVKALALACAMIAAGVRPAHGEDIVAVLERSQATRLASFAPVTASEHAAVVRRSFETLATRLDLRDRLELRVVSGELAAECLHGRIVVANQSLADLPEPARLFLLAHEIGHATLGHWQQMIELYATRVQGILGAPVARPAESEFLLDASHLSRRHEFEADAFAYAALRPLGYGFTDVVGALTAFGMQRDTATHPGTGKRIAHLRSLG